MNNVVKYSKKEITPSNSTMYCVSVIEIFMEKNINAIFNKERGLVYASTGSL